MKKTDIHEALHSINGTLNSMLPSPIASGSSGVKAQTNAPSSTKTIPEKFLPDSFCPERGDVVSGLRSIINNLGLIGDAASSQESLFETVGKISVQPKMDISTSPDSARIHYILDDIQMDDFAEISRSDEQRIAVEEMRHLYLHRKTLGHNVSFYRDNIETLPPWELKPEFWRCFEAAIESAGTVFSPRLAQKREAIDEINDTHLQKDAALNNIFYFKKNGKDQSVFIQKGTGDRYELEGVLAFVILESEPDHICCGLRNRGVLGGKANPGRHHQQFYIDGHHSLAKGERVFYAGEILFEKGEVRFWTNGSGHYKPGAELHIANFTDSDKRLLPLNRFRDHDKLTQDELNSLEGYLVIPEIPKDYEDSNSGSDSSLSEDDEDAAYIKQRLKSNGLRGGGASEEKKPEDICAPIDKTLERKPREEGPDGGGAGAGALSASLRAESIPDSDSEDDTKAGRPFESSVIATPSTATVSKPPDTVGPSIAELQQKAKIALNSGAEINAVQIGRMLEFVILLEKSTPAMQGSVIESELFKQANQLLRIPGYYFKTRFFAPGAEQVSKKIMLTLTQVLSNCVSQGIVSAKKARHMLAQVSPLNRIVDVAPGNIFASPEQQEQSMLAINLLIGTQGQRQERIAADNLRIEKGNVESVKNNQEFNHKAAELKWYSAMASEVAYKNFSNKRRVEEHERQSMISRSQAETQAKYQALREVRGTEWSGVLAGIALSETYQAGLSNAWRKQGQENSWRSVRSSQVNIDVLKVRSDSTASDDSGISSPGNFSRSHSLASITSTDIDCEISNMKSQLSPNPKNDASVPVLNSSLGDLPSSGNFKAAETMIEILEKSVVSIDCQIKKTSNHLSALKVM